MGQTIGLDSGGGKHALNEEAKQRVLKAWANGDPAVLFIDEEVEIVGLYSQDQESYDFKLPTEE